MKIFSCIFLLFAITSTFVTLSVTGYGLIERPIITGVPSNLTISNGVEYEKTLLKCNQHEKHYERSQQTNNSFDRFYRNILQDFEMKRKNMIRNVCFLQNTLTKIRKILFQN